MTTNPPSQEDKIHRENKNRMLYGRPNPKSPTVKADPSSGSMTMTDKQFNAQFYGREYKSDQRAEWEMGVQGRLGSYLNTMVDDLGIDNQGQYLRDLFEGYEKELRLFIAESKAELLDQVEDNICDLLNKMRSSLHTKGGTENE